MLYDRDRAPKRLVIQIGGHSKVILGVVMVVDQRLHIEHSNTYPLLSAPLSRNKEQGTGTRNKEQTITNNCLICLICLIYLIFLLLFTKTCPNLS